MYFFLKCFNYCALCDKSRDSFNVYTNDVKKYIEDWASYDDCINDFISAIESLCGNNAAVTALVCSVMTYSKKQGRLEAKLEKYKKIKHGMMQNLLTGKIRLV